MIASNGKKVLIFEPSLSGHRAHYVAVHSMELLKLGAKLCLAIPDNAMETPEGKTFLGNVISKVDHFPLPPIGVGLSVLANARVKLTMLCDSVAHCQADHCFVPYADGVSQAWGMKIRPKNLFPNDMPIEGLVMREPFAYPNLGWKRALTARVSNLLQRRAAWTRLHHLDPLAFGKIKKHRNPPRDFLIPDIVRAPALVDKAAAKQRLGLAPDRFVVACPGPVKTSKGSKSLIQAIKEIQEPVQLALIGKHSNEIKNYISDLKGDSRFFLVNRFATSEEFELLFSAADMIAVCYPKHFGSASILLRAVAAGKKIVASDDGWIGWATRKFQLGETCDASSPEAIRKLIVNVAKSGPTNDAEERTFAATKFLNYHSEENHLAHWTNLYRQRQGIPEPKIVKFDDVLSATGTTGAGN